MTRCDCEASYCHDHEAGACRRRATFKADQGAVCSSCAEVWRRHGGAQYIGPALYAPGDGVTTHRLELTPGELAVLVGLITTAVEVHARALEYHGDTTTEGRAARSVLQTAGELLERVDGLLTQALGFS